MSTAKRSRARQAGAKAISPTQPAPKRRKTTNGSHVPARSGLGFLVDEDARRGKKLEAKPTNGVPSSKNTRVDDSHAVIAPSQNEVSKSGSTQDNALEISSAESSSSEDDSEEEDEDLEQETVQQQHGKELVNGHHDVEDDDAMSKADAVAGAEEGDFVHEDVEQPRDEDEDEEVAEPSFGDLLQARHPEQIDVRASFPDPMADRQALIPASGFGAVTLPSGTSLVTVLTQALKTNDKAQLETCFQQTDMPTIRSTIQRLQSQHVATLLQRVAERIHKRPGRTGSLLVWIQWSLVAHGAYLATQPEVMAKLRSLSQVLKERASGLQPLLHLKGKLDMLAAQLDMRRSMQAASRARADAEDEEDEDGVLYVEGQDDDDWSDDSGEAVAGSSMIANDSRRTGEPRHPLIGSSQKRLQTATPNTDPSASPDDDDMPNGVIQEQEDEISGAEEDEEEGMLDIEAEEASEDDEEVDTSEAEDTDSEFESELLEDDESDASESIKPLDPAMLSRKR